MSWPAVAAPNAMTAAPAATPGLKKALRYWDLILYGLAYISPYGVLATLGFVWNASNGLIVLAYVLGAVCMYFTAKSYAVMTETIPTAGSVYGFARHSLGKFWGFLAGWMILLDYLLIPAFVYVLFSVAMSTLLPSIDRGYWIILLVAITTIVNWYGIQVTARANFIAVGLQVFVVVGFVILAAFALQSGKGAGALTLRPVFDPARFDTGKLFSAASICVMSYLGFDAISTLAEEVEGADRRVVSRAIVAVLLISAAFFVAVTFILGNLMQGLTIKDPAAAVYEVATWAVAPWAAVTLAWVNATIVAVSNALPTQVGVARVVFAMGRDGQLPRALARIHSRYQTPHIAMLSTAAVSLGVAIGMSSKLDELTSIVNFGALSGFLLLHFSVLAHFAFRHRSRAWLTHWVIPLCGIVVVLAVFTGMSALAVKVGLSWFVVGVLYGLGLKILGREELRAAL